jgi:alkylation response protein AidB-like acyl-CoA dehydrogenase
MDLKDTPEQARFRTEVRSWLTENLPEGWGTAAFEEPEDADARVAFLKSWQKTLHAGGWAGLDWPAEYGGRGIGIIENMIFHEEYAAAKAPNMINLSVGPSLVGPTVIACGTETQKKRFLQPILGGDEVWCQGFSEPNAGSDLASLKTRGEVRGDEIIVSGQKIWTSFAKQSDWCILVVRTDADAPKHKGLSFLLVDMQSPGITIRPLRELTGEAWFNEVFFDEVRVPKTHLVGELNKGWQVVMTTLAHERGSSAQHGRLGVEIASLIDLAKRTVRAGKRAADDPAIRQTIADFATHLMILKMTAYRSASALERNGVPGPEGSTLKLLWSELDQRVKDTAIELLGEQGLVPKGDSLAIDDGYWQHELLWSRAATIYAGTSEIQRNIIAQRVLGLPR